MRLVEQWNAIERGLDPRWKDARLMLTIADGAQSRRALALLAPAGPGRTGKTIRIETTRSGTGVGPEAIRRMLRRIDDEGIRGTLELVSSTEAATAPAIPRASAAAAWDAELARLPADWSDLLCELELLSTDYIERAAVLCIQMNPRRDGKRSALRFRAARRAGYGVSPEMARRCLERCDAESIRGTVKVLRVLSETKHVQTQGPVWIMSGQTV